MKEPARLLDSGTAFERSLLSSSYDEVPAKDLDRRVLAAMAGVPLANAASASALARWLSPKSVFAGVVAVGLGAIVVGAMLRREPSPAPSSPPVQPAPLAAAPSPPPVVADDPREVVMTPDALPNAPKPSAAKASTTTPSPAPVASASIAREIELLDQVKAKLGDGTPSEAARALDAYDQEFPAGTLRPEATVLRIRTLLLSGDRAGAEKVGNAFLARHPNGVFAKRVRALLEEK